MMEKIRQVANAVRPKRQGYPGKPGETLYLGGGRDFNYKGFNGEPLLRNGRPIREGSLRVGENAGNVTIIQICQHPDGTSGEVSWGVLPVHSAEEATDARRAFSEAIRRQGGRGSVGQLYEMAAEMARLRI